MAREKRYRESVLLKLTREQMEGYRSCSAECGLKVAEWMRLVLDGQARALLQVESGPDVLGAPEVKEEADEPVEFDIPVEPKIEPRPPVARDILGPESGFADTEVVPEKPDKVALVAAAVLGHSRRRAPGLCGKCWRFGANPRCTDDACRKAQGVK